MFGGIMTEAIVAIDMGNENLSSHKALRAWFNENGYESTEDSVESDGQPIDYSYYERVGVVIYRFDNTNDYFPTVVVDFINVLQDDSDTTISVAEDGELGYQTLIESTVEDFRGNVFASTESEDESESSESEDESELSDEGHYVLEDYSQYTNLWEDTHEYLMIIQNKSEDEADSLMEVYETMIEKGFENGESPKQIGKSILANNED